jgi:excisionase family DNA binding protein
MSKPRSLPESAPLKNALSYSEFAERVGISIPTARRMVKLHNLRVMRMSATLVRIPLSEILRFEAEATC